MYRKKRAISDQKSRVFARFDQKSSKRGAFCLAHFNIQALNRRSRAKNGDWEVEKARFRGVGEKPFSQSIDQVSRSRDC